MSIADVLSKKTDWHLVLGDCLDPVTGLASLPDGCADHVITDPPYSERVHARLGKEGRSDGAASRSGLTFSHLTPSVAAGVSDGMCRVVQRWMLFFCDELSFGVWVDALELSGGEYVRKGTWVKLCPMPQMSGDRPATGTEEIVIGHAPRLSGRTKWNGGGRTAVYQHNPQEDMASREHPAQKPMGLMEKIIRDFTDPGDLILDPFAGSGTTGVACRRLGRRFLGWERDPKFHAAAVKRISAAREQLGLLERAKAPKVEQGDMFKDAKVRP